MSQIEHAEGAVVHLANHDVGYVRVSRAPLEKLAAYRRRMGWMALLQLPNYRGSEILQLSMHL